jgi:DNA-binding NtrC family response regulator
MGKEKILIVEDNLLVSGAVEDILLAEGFDVEVAEDGKTANEKLSSIEFNMILLDMMLPDTTGKDLMQQWEKDYPNLPIVFMTAHGDIPTAVECLRLGAYDFLTKPVEKPLLIKTINNALKSVSLEKKVKILTELNNKAPDYSQLTDVIASSPEMKKTFDMLKMVSQSDYSCLLIKGESGTGKGLLARTIHKMGNRADKPFVEVNCSALPPTLIESELFGHKKGAFTDAKENKVGLFEMADGGTLFLDEIGDMDVNLQTKLLKVMEEQKFRRIGDTKDINVNVTIIAATNQDVEDLIEKDKFRLDLYYRLNVIPIEIPPLRDRKSDIPSLAEHFLSFFSRKFGKEIKQFSDECMKILMNYSWPGNVREFRNVVERSCILTAGDIIDNPELLFPSGVKQKLAVTTESFPAMTLAKAEELAIKAAMREADNNKNKAAKTLDIHRTTLYKKLEEYEIN